MHCKRSEARHEGFFWLPVLHTHLGERWDRELHRRIAWQRDTKLLCLVPEEQIFECV